MHKPLYQKIYEELRDAILSGQWPGGARLPSRRTMAANLGVSLNTVSSAYQQLVDEGYLEARERSGFYVEKLPWEELRRVEAPEQTHHTPEPGPQSETVIDFSDPGIDPALFPYSDFQRIYRDLWRSENSSLVLRPPGKGCFELRQELAFYLARSRGIVVTPEQIVIRANSLSLFRLLLKLLPPQCLPALEDPGFKDFYQELKQQGRPYLLLPVGAQGINPESPQLKRAGLVSVTPTHQFPTGSVMPIAARSNLLAWAAAGEERWLLEDDYDSEFRYEGMTIPSLKSLDHHDRVITLGNFSKSISPALRISYMVLPEALAARLEASPKAGLSPTVSSPSHASLKSDTSQNLFPGDEAYDLGSPKDSTVVSDEAKEALLDACPVNAAAQLALAAFLKKGLYEKHVKRLRTAFRNKRDLMLDCLGPDVDKGDIIGAEAGFHLNVRIHSPASEKELKRRFAAAGLRIEFLSDYQVSQKQAKEPSEKASENLTNKPSEEPSHHMAQKLETENEQDEKILILSFSSLSPEQIREGVEKIFALL